jgi:hypothetical protein
MTNGIPQSDPITPAIPDRDGTPAAIVPLGVARAALAGAVAGAISIAVAELVAGLVPGAPSLVLAIGALVIDLQPPGAKDLVVDLFGTNDKLALNVLITAAALLVAAGLGVLARRRVRRADAGFVAAGLLALVAAWREPLVSLPLAAVTVVVAVAAGLAALRFLLSPTAAITAAGGSPTSIATSRRSTGRLRRLGLESAAGLPAPAAHMPDWGRRRFLVRCAVLGLALIHI